jgi:hypothetical protein
LVTGNKRYTAGEEKNSRLGGFYNQRAGTARAHETKSPTTLIEEQNTSISGLNKPKELIGSSGSHLASLSMEGTIDYLRWAPQCL